MATTMNANAEDREVRERLEKRGRDIVLALLGTKRPTHRCAWVTCDDFGIVYRVAPIDLSARVGYSASADARDLAERIDEAARGMVAPARHANVLLVEWEPRVERLQSNSRHERVFAAEQHMPNITLEGYVRVTHGEPEARCAWLACEEEVQHGEA